LITQEYSEKHTDPSEDIMTTTATQSETTLPPSGTYVVDPAHSSVSFVARHLIGAKVRGAFSDVAGTIVIANPVGDSKVEAEVGVASVNTGQPQRDGHLLSPDFFDAEQFPKISLTTTGLERVSDDEWKLHSNLTVRGVTRPVTWNLEYLGTGAGMAPDSTVAAFSASTEVDRRDFEVSFSHALADSTLVVGNKVRLEIEVEAQLQS
jgi:polyisoprenoid-binding protein YceI